MLLFEWQSRSTLISSKFYSSYKKTTGDNFKFYAVLECIKIRFMTQKCKQVYMYVYRIQCLCINTYKRTYKFIES